MLKPICRLALAVLVAATTLAAADAMLGTWKMDMAKSRFNPGPGPRRSTVTFSQDGDWIVQKNEGVDAEGKSVMRSNRFKMDGKEYPYEGPGGGKGTIAIKRIDLRFSLTGVRKFRL